MILLLFRSPSLSLPLPSHHNQHDTTWHIQWFKPFCQCAREYLLGPHAGSKQQKKKRKREKELVYHSWCCVAKKTEEFTFEASSSPKICLQMHSKNILALPHNHHPSTSTFSVLLTTTTTTTTASRCQKRQFKRFSGFEIWVCRGSTFRAAVND